MVGVWKLGTPLSNVVDLTLAADLLTRWSRVTNMRALSADVLGARRFHQETEDLRTLPDNFDGEGSPHYSARTVSSATELVRQLTERYMGSFAAKLPLPSVLPGPEGSVDLTWKSSAGKLLLNVPPGEAGVPTAYGETPGGEPISLQIDSDAASDRLLRWIRDRWAAPT